MLPLGHIHRILLTTYFGHVAVPTPLCFFSNKVRSRCSIISSPLKSWCQTHWDVSLRWSAMRSDEPPPSWLSVIWRFIKVRGPRHACASRGFFYFMESLISRGSLASAHSPVLMNAAGDLSAQCVSSSSTATSRMHHMINRKGPVTLPKCVRGGMSVTPLHGEGLIAWVTRASDMEPLTASPGGNRCKT